MVGCVCSLLYMGLIYIHSPLISASILLTYLFLLWSPMYWYVTLRRHTSVIMQSGQIVIITAMNVQTVTLVHYWSNMSLWLSRLILTSKTTWETPPYWHIYAYYRYNFFSTQDVHLVKYGRYIYIYIYTRKCRPFTFMSAGKFHNSQSISVIVSEFILSLQLEFSYRTQWRHIYCHKERWRRRWCS